MTGAPVIAALGNACGKLEGRDRHARKPYSTACRIIWSKLIRDVRPSGRERGGRGRRSPITNAFRATRGRRYSRDRPVLGPIRRVEYSALGKTLRAKSGSQNEDHIRSVFARRRVRVRHAAVLCVLLADGTLHRRTFRLVDSLAGVRDRFGRDWAHCRRGLHASA